MGVNQHVVPRGDNWAVWGSKNDKATVVVRTQEQAIKIARDIAIAQQTELVIHGQDGKVRSRRSYAIKLKVNGI